MGFGDLGLSTCMNLAQNSHTDSTCKELQNGTKIMIIAHPKLELLLIEENT